MDWMTKTMDFLFGCHHRNLSRVFTIRGESYKVCWDCGAKFSYSLAKMSVQNGTHAPQAPALQDAPLLRSVR